MTSVSAVKFPKGSIRAYWKGSPTSRRVRQKQDALDLAKGQGGNTAAGAVPPAEGDVGQSAERAVRWGWTWAGLGWAVLAKTGGEALLEPRRNWNCGMG